MISTTRSPHLCFLWLLLLGAGCAGEYVEGAPGEPLHLPIPPAPPPNTWDRSIEPLQQTDRLRLWHAGACQGYTLFAAPAPNASSEQRVTLVDMWGKVVKQWNIWAMPPLLLPGGSVIGALRQRDVPAYVLQDARDLTQVDWQGKVEWSFNAWDSDGTRDMMARQHHDLQRQGSPVGYWAPGQAPLLTGTTLILGHETRLVPAVSTKPLTDDVFYEVDFQGKQTGFVWRAADHVEEMGFDPSAREALYLNPGWDITRGTGDWLHINSLSRLGPNRWYDQQRDPRFHPENLLFSARNANIIAIVERKSGRIVWRVGPELGPSPPDGRLEQLVGQHHAHMIPRGLPGAGNILVFDNGGQAGYGGWRGYPRHTRGWSRVVEFDPITLRKVWEYGSPDDSSPQNFFSYMISGAQRLPNGNTLITDGVNGHIFEVTRAGAMVWSYVSPFLHHVGTRLVYRAYRVPPEWIPASARVHGYPAWSDLYGG